jgi:hypothetical protein
MIIVRNTRGTYNVEGMKCDTPSVTVAAIVFKQYSLCTLEA